MKCQKNLIIRIDFISVGSGLEMVGDGKTDQAFYRPETGVWFVLPSGDSYYGEYFGAAASDILVPGDYDGDGKTDLAFYRPSTGVWFILPSGGGSWYAVNFGGGASDIPLTYNY